MSFLFQPILTCWNDWGRVFCDRQAFLPVANAILLQEGFLAVRELLELTPGTNAVFQPKNYNIVLKIYAPAETGLDTLPDFQTECQVMAYARQQGVAVPSVLARGQLQDRYLFRYVILEKISGTDFQKVFSSLSTAQKQTSIRRLAEIIVRLHVPQKEAAPSLPALLKKTDVYRQSLKNERWKGLPSELLKEIFQRVRQIQLENKPLSGASVLVHGDMTGDNFLMEPDGVLRLIDFADSHFAPPCYELPPIVLDLLDCDAESVALLLSELKARQKHTGLPPSLWIATEPDAFLKQLTNGIVLHDFGGNIIKDFAKKNHIPLAELTRLEKLSDILKKLLF